MEGVIRSGREKQRKIEANTGKKKKRCEVKKTIEKNINEKREGKRYWNGESSQDSKNDKIDF